MSSNFELPGVFFKPLKSKPIDWSGLPISIVSLGCGKLSALPDLATQAIVEAELIYGSQHHFDEIENILTKAEKNLFPSPFSRLADSLSLQQSRKIVILASGDALFYGVGSWLNRLVGNQNLSFFPNISSIQSCFHYIGLPWQNATIVSLHGRPLTTLSRYLKNQQLLAIFTDGKSTPTAIALELIQKGFANSIVWVCEAMGSDQQKVTQYTAVSLSETGSDFHALNICIVELRGCNQALTTFPGIPDHFFSTGSEPGYGMISKREVRLAILSLMQPGNGEIAWDVGAGCGSVSVEWARWNAGGQIYAIESHPQRMNHLISNNESFGTRLNLTPIEGIAPECCAQLPDPQCVFIGGSGGNLERLLNYVWERLTVRGKLVASAVTEESQAILKQFWQDKQDQGQECEWVTIQVSKSLPESKKLRDLKPVTLLKITK